MNNENLHELINRYTADFERINNSTNDEIFKWRAVQHFQNVWFSERSINMPFPALFKEAKRECSVLIDGARTMPANGIAKLAEQKPAEVEQLFMDVLFADDGGDIQKRQNNMDRFIAGIEELRMEIFPKNWKYIQDRRAASCYLSLFAPEENFIYKYSSVEKFSQFIEFGFDIGSGSSFRLDYYYSMCDLVVDALHEHRDLVDMHFSFIDDSCYYDDSLHIMAFDLIYCAWCYGYYSGLTHKSKKKINKNLAIASRIEKEHLVQEEIMTSLETKIHELEVQSEQYENISLINVEVFSAEHDKGIVTFQNGAYITVQYTDCAKKYEINRKYSQRPTFENDEEIVDALTEYTALLQHIKKLQTELERIEKTRVSSSK